MKTWVLALAMSLAGWAGAAEPFPGLPRSLTFPTTELTLADVRGLEQFIPALPGAWPFPRYDRYYALEQQHAHRVIIGLFMVRAANAGPGKIHILPRSQWNVVADGGCGVIHLRWVAGDAPSYWCNGID